MARRAAGQNDKCQGQTYYLTSLLTSPFIVLKIIALPSDERLSGQVTSGARRLPAEVPQHRPEVPAYPKALLRRIKQLVIAREHTFFAVTNPGLENLCRQQIRSLLSPAAKTKRITGGVEFKGKLTDCYLVNLHCRFAIRVLMRIATFRAGSFASLEKNLAQVAWELYLPPAAATTIKVTCRKSRLYHSGAVSQRIGRSIAARIGNPAAPDNETPLTVYGRLEHDRLTLSVDSSGPPLFKRGLKARSARAPLRETTASAVLALAGWHPTMELVDPMCGSGSFSLEAAMAAKQIPPGWYRDFAFYRWPAFRPRHWRYLKKQAGCNRLRLKRPLIRASDIDQSLVRHLASCLQLHGLDDAVAVQQADFLQLRPCCRPGYLVLNPPYGRRLEHQKDPDQFYRHLAKHLLRHWRRWHLALLAPPGALKYFRQAGLKQRRIFHGGLHPVLVCGRID